MKITAIKQQQKRADRYSVYVDGKYAFSLSENDLLALKLRSGQELSTVEYGELERQTVTGNAYDRALQYLSIRPRSEFEIKDYLRRKKYGSDVIESVLNKLRQLRLIDDTSFALQWVEWRRIGRPRSRRQLYAELRQKGVDNEVIDEALGDINDLAEIEAARAIAAKKARQYDSKSKFMAYLSRQGFSYDVIRRIVDDAAEDGKTD